MYELLLSWGIKTPFINAIVGAIIGATITYIFTVFKMKKDRKINFEKDIGSKIAASLYDVRVAIEDARTFEIYDIDNSLTESANSTQLNDFSIYPAILNDSNSLLDFWKKINDVRKKHELYLSYKSSAYLLYMSNYLTKLIQFMSQDEDVDYHLVGTILIFDIQKWEKAFDKLIVKELNRKKLKLTSKNGSKWEREKQKKEIKYWNPSFLKLMIEKKDSNSNDTSLQINHIIFEIINKS